MGFNRNSHLNLDLQGSLEHTNRNTKVDLDAKYGADSSDSNKQLVFALESNHRLANLMSVDADIVSGLKFPVLV